MAFGKKELEERVATSLKCGKKEAGLIVETVFDTVSEVLLSGEDVRVAGFGTFKISEKAERKGYNPKTGEPIVIPAHKTVALQLSKDFKERLN